MIQWKELFVTKVFMKHPTILVLFTECDLTTCNDDRQEHTLQQCRSTKKTVFVVKHQI